MAGLCLSGLSAQGQLLAQVVCAVYALQQAWQWLHQRPVLLVFERGSGQAWVDGRAVDVLQLGWRCGLPQLRWRIDGRWQRRVCLPGQLPPAVLSELRQWPRQGKHSRNGAPVAP